MESAEEESAATAQGGEEEAAVRLGKIIFYFQNFKQPYLA